MIDYHTFILYVVGWIGSSIYRQSFTTRLTLAIVNDYSGGNSSIEPLENSLKDALGCGKKDLIEINSGLFINTDEPQAPNMLMPVWQRSQLCLLEEIWIL